MKLSEVCIKRPVLAWVLTFMLVLIGIVCFFRLSVQQYPKAATDSPMVMVETQLRGAGPEIIENQITAPIEETLAGIEGVDSMFSSSESETSKITLEFSPDRPIDSAVNDIRDRLMRVHGTGALPPEATQPTIQKSRADERPIISIALTSNTKKRGELFDIATHDIQKEFEALPGVARVEIVGASNYEMKIYLDPKKLHGFNLTVPEVVQAIEKQNVEKPAGKLTTKTREYVVTIVANLEKVEEFESLVIQTRKDHLIRLKDIGRVELSSDDMRTRTRFNGEGAVGVLIIKQSGSNPIEVSKTVRLEMDRIKKILPRDVKFEIAFNPTVHIEHSIREVYKTLIEAIILVILVVFFFLRSARATMIPIITIPVSLIGTMFLMYVCGFSINIYTLMALVLAIGLVVDDAIVVLENVYKFLEKGHRPFDAAIKGIREISFAVVAMTLTLAAVYAPVALAKGKTGKLLSEFSITLAGAVIISGFVALTLSPMMCARMLGGKENRTGVRNIWYKLKDLLPTEHLIGAFESFYENALHKIIAMKTRIVLLSLFVSALGGALFYSLPAELEPKEDKGSIEIHGAGPQTANRDFVDYYLVKMDKIIRDIKEVKNVIGTIITPGYDLSIELCEKEKRSRSTTAILKEMKEKLSTSITGIQIVSIEESRSGGFGNSSAVQLVVRANKNHKEIQNLASEFQSAILRSGISDGISSANLRSDAEDYVVNILRNKSASLNIDPQNVAETVSVLMGGQKAKKFKRDNKLYDVRVCMEDSLKRRTNDITNLFVKSGGDRTSNKEPKLVQLSELVSIYSRSGPKQIQHHNRMRSMGMNVSLVPSVSLNDAIKKIDQIALETLPQDVRYDYIDDTKRFLTESHTMLLVFGLALSFIYFVMAAQFESWRDPLIIMITVPLSLSGALFSLACIPGSINLYSNIGFVTLIGLITKHGILMVDFANLLRKEGSEMNDAIIKAARQRLRPILMTTFAMVLGALPMALASGAGSESRQQLGWVIVGGMSIGTLFTLFILPTMYTIFSSKKVSNV